MGYTEVLDLSEVIGEGFFADKTVRLLEQTQPLDANSEKLLREVLHFIEKAKKGERQVESGKLAGDALDSIGIYSRAIRIISLQSIEEGLTLQIRKAFRDMLNAIESEVRLTIRDREINPENLKKTRNFFNLVRRQTLNEASKYYSRKVEVVTWPSRLY
jgi:hypothetical protein